MAETVHLMCILHTPFPVSGVFLWQYYVTACRHFGLFVFYFCTDVTFKKLYSVDMVIFRTNKKFNFEKHRSWEDKALD